MNYLHRVELRRGGKASCFAVDSRQLALIIKEFVQAARWAAK